MESRSFRDLSIDNVKSEVAVFDTILESRREVIKPLSVQFRLLDEPEWHLFIHKSSKGRQPL